MLFKLDYIILTFSVAFSKFNPDVFIFIAYRHTYEKDYLFFSSYLILWPPSIQKPEGDGKLLCGLVLWRRPTPLDCVVGGCKRRVGHYDQ